MVLFAFITSGFEAIRSYSNYCYKSADNSLDYLVMKPVVIVDKPISLISKFKSKCYTVTGSVTDINEVPNCSHLHFLI